MTGRLRVAVCTNRRPAQAAEAVAALRAQVPEGLLAVVTSGLSPAGRDAHAGQGTVLLDEPREGLSLARNRALRWCDEVDAIAFVDDDAIAEKGWYAALSRAWESAPDDLGCIGGPIHPRFAAPAPAWLSPPLLPALTLLDLGPDERDLDPEVTTVYGANISFRVAPLRTAGGFDPHFGHSGERIYFSEEDEAQRALGRLGFRIRYLPDAAVTHVIPAERLTRGSFLRRRFAYGRALGARRARTRRLAARQAASSGIGTLVAALRRQDALAMERAVRSVENLGVLYGSTRPRRMA